MTGRERIGKIFAQRGARTLLMTHAIGGWPDEATSEAIVRTMLAEGADLVEIQVPFSEPAADGPAIVAASHEALAGGMTTARTLALIGRLRRGAGAKALLVMTYLNPVLAYGEEAFVRDAVTAGVDGLIVPDCPLDEISPLPELAAAAGLAFVPLVAPATSDRRIAEICARFVSPFVYAVLRLGVTGRATGIDAATRAYLERVARAAGRGVAAGFGIRERGQIEALAGAVQTIQIRGRVMDVAGGDMGIHDQGMDAIDGAVVQVEEADRLLVTHHETGLRIDRAAFDLPGTLGSRGGPWFGAVLDRFRAGLCARVQR